ncbi:MAG: integrase [Hyphomonadaceae bacterium]
MPKKSKNALDGEIITIQRGLAIYKVNASPYWQARIRDPRIRRYVVRSTQETSRVKAKQVARELAFDLLGTEKRVEREFSFRYYANRLISKGQRMVANGERNANYVRTMHLFLNNTEWGLIKTFGHKDIRELKTRDYQEMMDSLSRKRSDLSTSTRNMLTATFRNVLKVARDDGAIDTIPSTPRTRQKDNPRSYFPFYPLVEKERDQYRAILRAANTMAREGMSVRGVPITKELYHLILFTTHSFLRPIISELYALKHRDVTVADDPKRLLLTIRNGKTGYRVSNTMQLAVGIYRHIKQRNPDAGPDDYLFFPEYTNRETASKIVQRQFREVMKRAGVKDDPEAGIKYTIYSLRHTAICMRLTLSHGQVNIFNLAKNAGTSVEQIERFYAKNLPLSREMAINLQQFGGQH